MKNIPWRGLFITGLVMTILVSARCIATAVRENYYQRQGWQDLILQDFWFYVGIASALVCIISAVVCLIQRGKAKRSE